MMPIRKGTATVIGIRQGQSERFREVDGEKAAQFTGTLLDQFSNPGFVSMLPDGSVAAIACLSAVPKPSAMAAISTAVVSERPKSRF